MRKRYRYILNGQALGHHRINSFRLIAGNNIKPSYDKYSAIRVEIPNDLILEKYKCDPYSTTDDIRTLDELGYDILIWNKKLGKWIKHNELKGVKPCNFMI